MANFKIWVASCKWSFPIMSNAKSYLRATHLAECFISCFLTPNCLKPLRFKTSISQCSELAVFYSLEHVRQISRQHWAEEHLTIFLTLGIAQRVAAKLANFLNPQLPSCASRLAFPLDSKRLSLYIHWAHAQAHSRRLTKNGRVSCWNGLRGRVEILLRTAWVQILALPNNKDHLQN